MQKFLSIGYANYTWREEMRRDQQNRDNPTRTPQYQVAKLLEGVGGRSANSHGLQQTNKAFLND